MISIFTIWTLTPGKKYSDLKERQPVSPEQITTYAAIVQAAAAVVSLTVAGVLAIVTHRYMKLTKGILDETAKARVAAERSASAAQESASATLQSLHLLRQQLEEQAGIGRLTVESTIDSAVAAIHHLKSQGLGQWAVVRALPSTANLFPQKANAASDHAARISTALAMKLSTAFDDLRVAFDQIERLRNLVSALGIDSGALSPTAVKVDELLTRALTRFMEAKALLPPSA
jgi:chemotaxis protein histidine kinase CheA